MKKAHQTQGSLPCLVTARKPGAFLLAFTMGLAPAYALESLSDDGLSEVSGTGLAFPFENIHFQMAPTSFVELTGVSFANCVAPGNPSGCVDTSLKRGDLRYYGLTMSQGATYAGTVSNKMVYNLSNANTMNWDRTACSGGFNGLGCPTSQYGINAYSTVDNPFVLRAFDYNKMGYAGTNITQTLLEFIGPSNMDPFRWAFWGEVEAGRTVDGSGNITGMTGLLKSQSLILGKPAARVKAPSLYGTDDVGGNANPYAGPVLRLFQDVQTSSLGLNYISRLSGDFRFSVNQLNDIQTARGAVPTFTAEEGLYFNDVNAYLPLGQLNYQALTLDRVAAGNGNFALTLTRIPDDSRVYGVHYALPTAITFPGCGSTAAGSCGAAAAGYNRVLANANSNYYTSHGYVEWGTDFPSCGAGQPNCLGGSNTATNYGASAVRFSGPGSTGLPVTKTYSLEARAMVAGAANGGGYWSGDTCGGDPCDSFTNGTAQSVSFTVTYSSPVVSSIHSRQDVINAGGVVFVSRTAGSTWQVPNNQAADNTTAKLIELENRDDVKEARSDYVDACGFLCTDLRLSVDATPDTAAIQSAANAVFGSPSGTNYAILNVNAINLGASRVEGLLINHMKITSLGAN